MRVLVLVCPHDDCIDDAKEVQFENIELQSLERMMQFLRWTEENEADWMESAREKCYTLANMISAMRR